MKRKRTMSRDGKMRYTVRVDARLTIQEYSILEGMLDEFRASSGDEEITLSAYCAILLRQRIDEEPRCFTTRRPRANAQ